MSQRISKFHAVIASRKEVDESSKPLPTTPHESPPLTTTDPDSPPVTTATRPAKRQKGVAPERDFNRRANSLERDAMPAGLFPGSTFKVYNAIYIRTLGAINPRRTVRASRRDFIEWTDIRNLKTVDTHLRYLIAKGLLVRRWELGSNEGSEYEIILPEELPRLTTSTHQSPRPATSQESGSGYPQESGSGGQGQLLDSQRPTGEPKTELRLKDEKLDDEAAPFAGVIEAFTGAVKDLTGKAPVAADEHRWRELAEVLIMELRIAAARTDSISSVPAFLSEHLRRRLFKKDKAKLESEEKASPAPREPQIDASKCPDCGGSNFWYPEGFDKGVARCDHPSLRDS